MKSLQGKLLVATPQLVDPNFQQTVTLLVQHNKEGALGLVLNRPSRMKLREAWRQVSEEPCERDEWVHVGGPCQGPLMILHGDAERCQVAVTEGLYFAADPDDVAALVGGGERPIRFFAGYAGWGPGQLEGELRAGSWLVAPASHELVFAEPAKLWSQLIRAVGPDQSSPMLAPRIMPPDPSYN